MKLMSALLLPSLLIGAQPLVALADDGTGVERMGSGVVETVSSPAKIPEGIAEGAKETGPVTGTVTGTVKGSASAAGQAVKGAANVGVGAVEAVTKPLSGN